MEIIPGINAVPDDIGETVVTVGMFDGVHRGHRRIIDIAHRMARKLGLRCVVFTFDRHPLEVLSPGDHPKLLSSSAQKLRLLEELDVDMVLMVHFDREFSRISAADFAKEILHRRLRAREVVLGENFRFGRSAEGDVEFLSSEGENLGFRVRSVPLLRDGGEVISSTSIRKLLEKGEVEEAAERLGRHYMIEGVVVKGDSRGKELGFPTANLEIHDNRCIPASGVYAGKVHLEHGTHPAVTYIGELPTFYGEDSGMSRIEVHIPGFSGDLYQHYIGVDFRKRLRGDTSFSTPEELQEQIRRDIQEALRGST